MEKHNHSPQKQIPQVVDGGQKEGGTKQFSPPTFQLTASSGEEAPFQVAMAPLQMGLPNNLAAPSTPESSARDLRAIFSKIQDQESVDEYEVNGVFFLKDAAYIGKIKQAYADTYHSDLVQDLYHAMNAQPQNFVGGLFAALTWILGNEPNSDAGEVLTSTPRDGGENDLLAVNDPQFGTNHLRVEGPSGIYPLVGQPFKVSHAETVATMNPMGSTYRQPFMERAILSTSPRNRLEMNIQQENNQQFFNFTPPSEGMYTFQCYIRHALEGGKTHIQIMTRTVWARPATDISAIGLTTDQSATLGNTALETYRASMELQAMGLEEKDPQQAAVFKQYLGQVDATMDHFLPGTEVPVQAALTLDQAWQGQNKVTAATQPLVLYLGKSAKDPSRFLLADFTAMAPRREYGGSSIEEVLKDFAETNKYEQGAISLQINPNQQGYPTIKQTLPTGGQSLMESASSIAGWASLGLSLAGLTAALVPGAQLAAPYLLLAAAATNGISSTLDLADEFQNATISQTKVTLDILSLVSSIIGGAAAFKALKSGNEALQLTKLGNFFLYTDVTLNGATALVLSEVAVDQINDILVSELPRGEKIGRITRVLSSMAIASGLFALSLNNPAIREAVRLRSDVKARMLPVAETFGPMFYTETDVKMLLDKSRSLNFSQKEIEDLIFVANRDAKRITAADMMNQMEYARLVQARGYPSKFRDLDEFNKFRDELKAAVKAVGCPVDDIRIQGSALRNPNADDVDIAIMLPENEFDAIIIKAYNSKLKENGVALDMTNFKHADLVDLLGRIESFTKKSKAPKFASQSTDPKFEGKWKDFKYVFGKKMINTMSMKAEIEKVFPARSVLNTMKKEEFTHLNIKNISVQTPGGPFDLHPFLRL